MKGRGKDAPSIAAGAIIAIDGPSGVGKTTVSRLVARRLGFRYVDTGAMYRAFAVSAVESGVDLEDEKALEKFSLGLSMDFSDGGTRISANGKDLTGEIRTPLAGRLASIVSSKKAVRAFLVARQRELGRGGGLVMEGRDIGTVVFPNAPVKIFLDAPDSVRAGRRHGELREAMGPKKGTATLDDVARELSERDRRDLTRTLSPLKKAGDSVYIDTSTLGIEEVARRIFEVIRERLGIGDTDS